eukprot:CAMPEP_0198610762 /NCGR_PEP_ID=MMETSP1462-20131121/157055_1 /TAXON_ID=1333877 /ORGANISM="Brandtodinium nutriculum, Strain RCC3387" /LENGTH=625 /DNA_ID=CAMNT_0044342567 /DNA_START=693 /DNA_END=2566 /DNA_ORIENTATION=-
MPGVSRNVCTRVAMSSKPYCWQAKCLASSSDVSVSEGASVEDSEAIPHKGWYLKATLLAGGGTAVHASLLCLGDVAKDLQVDGREDMKDQDLHQVHRHATGRTSAAPQAEGHQEVGALPPPVHEVARRLGFQVHLRPALQALGGALAPRPPGAQGGGAARSAGRARDEAQRPEPERLLEEAAVPVEDLGEGGDPVPLPDGEGRLPVAKRLGLRHHHEPVAGDAPHDIRLAIPPGNLPEDAGQLRHGIQVRLRDGDLSRPERGPPVVGGGLEPSRHRLDDQAQEPFIGAQVQERPRGDVLRVHVGTPQDGQLCPAYFLVGHAEVLPESAEAPQQGRLADPWLADFSDEVLLDRVYRDPSVDTGRSEHHPGLIRAEVAQVCLRREAAAKEQVHEGGEDQLAGHALEALTLALHFGGEGPGDHVSEQAVATLEQCLVTRARASLAEVHPQGLHALRGLHQLGYVEALDGLARTRNSVDELGGEHDAGAVCIEHDDLVLEALPDRSEEAEGDADEPRASEDLFGLAARQPQQEHVPVSPPALLQKGLLVLLQRRCDASEERPEDHRRLPRPRDAAERRDVGPISPDKETRPRSACKYRRQVAAGTCLPCARAARRPHRRRPRSNQRTPS